MGAGRALGNKCHSMMTIAAVLLGGHFIESAVVDSGFSTRKAVILFAAVGRILKWTIAIGVCDRFLPARNSANQSVRCTRYALQQSAPLAARPISGASPSISINCVGIPLPTPRQLALSLVANLQRSPALPVRREL
jgi:hypothetical protein